MVMGFGWTTERIQMDDIFLGTGLLQSFIRAQTLTVLYVIGVLFLRLSYVF
jgi:hypothetical protein